MSGFLFTTTEHELMKPSLAKILELLKTSGGLPVSDLSKELEMSYMGVKQHCQKLTRLGLVEEWRIPREEHQVGRPQKLYRLTPKSDPLFPSTGPGLTLSILEGARVLFGDSAPEKLLFQHFQSLATSWSAEIPAEKPLLERAEILTKLRFEEGWINKVREDSEGTVYLDEFHSPMKGIYEAYPIGLTLEIRSIEAALGTRIEEVDTPWSSGQRCLTYRIHDPLSQ